MGSRRRMTKIWRRTAVRMPPTAMQMIQAGKKDPWTLTMGSHPDVRHQMAPAVTHGGRKCPTELFRSTMKQHSPALDPAASAGPSLYLADHRGPQEDVMSEAKKYGEEGRVRIG